MLTGTHMRESGAVEMSEPFTKPFTKAEMEAMREATRDEEGLKRRFWEKFKRVAGKIPFAEDLVAAFFCATDPSTPSRVKLILLGAIAYFVFPTGAITEEHKERARQALQASLEEA